MLSVSQPNRTVGVVTDCRGPEQHPRALLSAGCLFGTSFDDSDVKHKVLTACLLSDL
jgi:hypothetical protein